MAAITLEDVNQNLAKQSNTLESADEKLAKMSGSLSSLVDMFKSRKLKAREEAIEGGSKAPPPKETGAGVDAFGGGLFGGMLAGALAAITGTIGAVAAGLVTTFTEFGNDLSRTFASIFVIGRYTKIFDQIGSLFKEGGIIANYFDSLRKGILRMMYIGEDGKAISKVFKGVQGAQGAGPIAKTFRVIRNVYNFFEEFVASPVMKGIGKVLGSLGPILKKIFLPFGLIFTAYDVVKGAIEGFEEEGWVGGITGAISGLLASIVGAPLNLIKSITSWVLEKFGFEDAAAFLDEEVDFEKAIKDAGMAVANFFNNIPERIGELIQALIPDWLRALYSNEENNERDESGAVVRTADSYDEFGNVENFNKGTKGKTGKLFKNFGNGTPVMLHGNEAVVPKNSPEGAILSQYENIKKTGSVTGSYGLGETVGMTESARKLISSMEPSIPRPDRNGLGDTVTSMVRESQEAGRVQPQPAPVVIQDNSSRSTGVTNTAMPVQSQPFDYNDPFVKGLAAF